MSPASRINIWGNDSKFRPPLTNPLFPVYSWVLEAMGFIRGRALQHGAPLSSRQPVCFADRNLGERQRWSGHQAATDTLMTAHFRGAQPLSLSALHGKHLQALAKLQDIPSSSQIPTHTVAAQLKTENQTQLLKMPLIVYPVHTAKLKLARICPNYHNKPWKCKISPAPLFHILNLYSATACSLASTNNHCLFLGELHSAWWSNLI